MNQELLPNLDRASEIFEQACERTGGDQDDYVRTACEGNAALYAEVESMLRAYRSQGDFLAEPTVHGSARIAEQVGDQIGSYHLLERIGEGGFGVVYLAEQREPIKRRVALKVIKAGMDTRQVVARFEAERQALAMLDHPHVCSVLDCGATDTGRPYFVMEYIRGMPLLEYCDAEKLDTRARLELFISVGSAIQHAHQKGIIHRDIKPTNVLVTLHDGVPVPKVIDFGIAKATNAELTQKTLFTEHRQLIGTPAYMSPEQAEMSGLDIDTRTDVYSLGVLLYELLTGTTPFDSRSLLEAGLVEMRRIIREDEPHKPSRRLLVGEASARIASQRRANVSDLSSAIRGDLDWIIMKCLEKDRTRRYETVNGLADDLQRHMQDEPVHAGPPSTAYRLRKFVKRNRRGVLIGSVLVVVMVLGLVGTTLGLLEAESQRELAAERADRLQEVVRFQSRQLSVIVPQQMGKQLRDSIVEAAPPPQRETLSKALESINFTTIALQSLRTNILDPTLEVIEEQFSGQPFVKAQLLQSMAITLGGLGLPDQAKETQETALELLRQTLGDDHPATLFAFNEMGAKLWRAGLRSEAEEFFERALEGRRRVLGDDHPQTLTSFDNRGVRLWQRGQITEAEVYFRKALEGRRRVLGDDHQQTLRSLNHMALVLEAGDNLSEAARYCREALELRQRSLGVDHRDTLSSLKNMGSILKAQGKFNEAELYLRRALDGHRRVLGDDHPETLTLLSSLGSLLGAQRRGDEAVSCYEQSLNGLRRVLGDDHPDTVLPLHGLGVVLWTHGKLKEAQPYLEQALESRRRSLGSDHPETLLLINSNAGLLNAMERFEEAADLAREAIETGSRAFGQDYWRVAEAQSLLGEALLGLEQFDDVERLLLDSYAALAAAAPEERRRQSLAEAARRLVDLYEALGKLELASEWKSRAQYVPAR